MAEKWGLKIVEAPVDFMCKETAGDSFQSFVNIKLAVDPPICDHLTLETSAKIEIPHQWFEMELLKQFNFVLDVEADDAMPPKSVKYSYLHKRWPNTQFVHRSGLAFIQILPRGEGFMWVYNRVPLNNSTFRSNTPESIADVVKNEFQSFCSDSLLLEEFWHARKAQLMETQTTTNGHIDD